MEKSIVITGRQGSGKTTKAKEIANQFSKDEVVFLYYRQKKLKNTFIFSECTEKTKLVVFEELYDIKQVEEFFSFVSNPITVNKRGKNPFIILPKFVLVCQSDITQEQFAGLGASFGRRFDVINCQYNGDL
jgi:uridine kinase